MKQPKVNRWLVSGVVALIVIGGGLVNRSEAGPSGNPILFVTQFPIAADFTTIGSVFGNHSGRIDGVGRGGDLYIRYPDGSLRNLTAEAGFGSSGVHQGTDAIAVRDPQVHWDGTKAVFSMVIGAPPSQYVWTNERWQMYEVTGLGPSDTAVITIVPNQPSESNNISPIYSSDGRIFFTTDRPLGGAAHLYPQHDEYESTPTNSGLWVLDPVSGDLSLLQHSPSGSFTPTVDSFGRVIFTRWDHLQQDQQADADALAVAGGGPAPYGTFNYSDESASALLLDNRDEVFPEPRAVRTDLLSSMTIQGHQVIGQSINHFFPWQINQDGTAEETINHVGRHDLHYYFDRSLSGDPNIDEFIDSVSGRPNTNPIVNMLQIKEDPTQAGRFIGIDAPEFDTHAAGQVIAMNGAPGTAPDQMLVAYITHRDTETVVDDGTTPPVNHSGHYRDPLPLADGTIVAAHTAETRGTGNQGTRANPDPRYDFRLKPLIDAGNGHLEAGASLTGGISKEITYWDPDVLVSYDGPLWELSPVEVRSRPVPPLTGMAVLEAPEAQIFSEEGIDVTAFRQDLADKGVALIVSRNITTRDSDDLQQPFNLSVPGGPTTVGMAGEVYSVSHLQLFQGDLIRGIGGIADPNPGRRVLAQVMHDPAVDNPPNPAGPSGSVAIAADGSMAALVPAHRAMAWHLVAADHAPVVRERFWISFQPGEIRLCGSCHGLSSTDQAGNSAPQNPPEALRTLLRYWNAEVFADGFESGDGAAWTVAAH